MMLSIRTIERGDGELLSSIFESIRSDPICDRFRPHPLTAEYATDLCRCIGSDVYILATHEGEAAAYGMLRGWDAGFEVPSLGICVLEGFRGRGLSRAVVEHLHERARLKGARRVRLRVAAANAAAIRLYRACGYEFSGAIDRDELVAFADL